MRWKPFLPALLWLVAITFLSLSSNVPMPKIDFFSPDKLAHAGAYALLTALLALGVRKSKNSPLSRKNLFLIFCFAAGYGAFMEWVQGTYFPNRFFEYYDMLANASGALFALVILNSGLFKRKN
jgi:VanZ family protein